MAGAVSLGELSIDEFEELGRSFVRRMGFDLRSLQRLDEDSFIVLAERVDPDGNTPCVLLFKEGEVSTAELKELSSSAGEARRFVVADGFLPEAARHADQNGVTLIDAQRLEEMLEALGIVHLAYPAASPERRITDPKEVERKVEWALLLYGREEFGKAIGILDDVLRMRPAHREARRYRVECLIRMGELARARRDLEAMILRDPKDADALFLLAHVHFLEERKDEERACYVKILEIDDKHKEAWLNLGVLLSHDDEAKAILCFRNATKVDIGDPRPWNNLGVIERRRGDLKAAEDAFAEGAKSARATPEIVTNLVATRLAQGKLDGSVEVAKRLLDMDPRGADPWLAIGWVFAVNGDDEGALRALQKAANWDETVDPEVMLARMTGRPAPARPLPRPVPVVPDAAEAEPSTAQRPTTRILRPSIPSSTARPDQEVPPPPDDEVELSPLPARRSEDILDDAFAQARKERLRKAEEGVEKSAGGTEEDETGEGDAESEEPRPKRAEEMLDAAFMQAGKPRERPAGAVAGSPSSESPAKKRPEDLVDSAFAAAALAMKRKEARATARAGVTQALKTTGPVTPAAKPSPRPGVSPRPMTAMPTTATGPAPPTTAGGSNESPAAGTDQPDASDSPELSTRLLIARALLARGRAGQVVELLSGRSDEECLLRAAAHERLGRSNHAEEELGPLADRGDARALAALARIQLERDQPHRALEILARVREENDVTWILRANALAGVGRTDEAVAEAEKLSHRGSVRSCWIGAILQRGGRAREAELRYKEAIEAQPLSWISWNNLGVLARAGGDLEAGKLCLERAAHIRAEPGVARNLASAAR